MSETLGRRKREKHVQHRALLLWAMQHPDRRSLRAVARAVGRSESTLRGWMRTGQWPDRASSPNAEHEAIAAYRRLYLKRFGEAEIPEVRSFIVVPFSTHLKGEPPPTEAAAAVRAVDAKVTQEIIRRKGNEDALREKHLTLVDGALGYVVNEMKEKRIRATLRDIPTLLEARSILEGSADNLNGAAPAETVRVRNTRSAGGDIIEAMWEDIEELQVIVGALRTREQAAMAEKQPGLVALTGGKDEPDAS